MKCLYCSVEHDRKGKYCSNSCKMKDYRRRNATVTVETLNVTVKDESVTVSDTVTQDVIQGGICWCCGDSDIPVNTICCGPCAWSGKAKIKRAGRLPASIGRPAWSDMYVLA